MNPDPSSRPPSVSPKASGATSAPRVSLLAATLATCASALTSSAQPLPVSASSSAATAIDEETVVLSPFVVVIDPDNDRYAPSSAISGGRVRVDIFDSSQNISVISSELLGDVAATRILDATKLVPGVTESTIPNGLDRITIRGFQTSSRTLDGITSSAQSNLDPFLLERIEVVKGPNAILAPSGSPGGTINGVSKKPLFRNTSSISVETGLFDSDRLELDYNQVLAEDRVAFRFLGATQQGEDWWGSPKELLILAPMLTWRPGPDTEATFQLHYIDWDIQNYNGIAIAPDAGTTNEARLYPGVPRDLNIFGPDSYRRDERLEATTFITHSFTPDLSARFQHRYSDRIKDDFSATNLAGAGTSAATNNRSFDPRTGNYTPGIVYDPVTFAPTTVAISPIFQRSGQRASYGPESQNLLLDLFHTWEVSAARFDTLLGFAWSTSEGTNFRNQLTAPAVTLTDFVYSPDVVGSVSSNLYNQDNSTQFYLSEKISLIEERLILNAGLSRNFWDLHTENYLNSQKVDAEAQTTLYNYGFVVKPLPEIALFYGFSQNAAPLGAQNIANGQGPTQNGEQHEGGIRYQPANGRLRVSASYFDITQSNFTVSNPGNFAFPPPPTTLPPILSDRAAQGFELEFQGSITEDLSLIAAFTDYENRNPFGQEFRGNAERAWSAFLHYSFPANTVLDGLSGGIGVDYLSERPGDDANGFTPAGVARKPTFYLPARTLVNLSLAYRFADAWRLQVNIDNLLDEEYLAASLGRGVVWPGTPLNARARLTYTF